MVGRRWEGVGRGCQTHYWALRQQARGVRAGVRPRWGVGVGGWRRSGGSRMVCLLPHRFWWWGVVFDSWIVVASIRSHACRWPSWLVVGVWFVVV